MMIHAVKKAQSKIKVGRNREERKDRCRGRTPWYGRTTVDGNDGASKRMADRRRHGTRFL